MNTQTTRSENAAAATRILDVRGCRRKMETENAALIDVRGFDEFAAGHAAGATCIPLPDLERRCAEIPTDKPVFVICQSGGRSQMAADRLRALGFDNIVDTEGGMNAWAKAGLPVVRQSGVIPLERQVRGAAGALVCAFTLAGLFRSRRFFAGSLFVGGMLFLSSVTGFCPMMSLLKLMPWNKLPANPASA
jgi:rhodanese-related sulfurtransferase